MSIDLRLRPASQAPCSDRSSRDLETFGVGGDFRYGRFGEVLRATRTERGAAFRGAALAGAAAAQLQAVFLLRDQIDRALGGYGALSLLVLVAANAGGAVLGARSMSAGQDRARRAVTLGALGATGLMLSAIAAAPLWLCALVLAGLASGAQHAVLTPLLVDSYPPEARGRVLSILAGGVILSMSLVAWLVAAAATVGLSWRVVVVLVGVAGLVASLTGLGLADQEPGAWDRTRLIQRVRRREGQRGDLEVEAVPALRFSTEIKRVVSPQVIRPLLWSAAAVGALAFPVQHYVAVLWRDDHGLGEVASLRLAAVAWLGGLLSLVLMARRLEINFRSSPAALSQELSWLTTVVATLVALTATMPTAMTMAMAWTLTMASAAVLLPAIQLLALASVPPSLRSHAAAVLLVCAMAGAVLGGPLLDTVGSRFGPAWGLTACAFGFVLAGRRLASVIPAASEGVHEVVSGVVEEETRAIRASLGESVPLLSCSGIDFSYGQLQVLFGVDLFVDDGEMVALMGTNGAGKSTLLRLVSGLAFPQRGSVRFAGGDVTHVGPDHRVEMGICQIPGGKAVFRSLSVVENLRVYAYSQGRHSAAISAGIDETFAAFPRLAERRNQLASTLSGGEQQMLALGKALILRPRLLLIDELSLGLAPIVVGELLDLIRTINDRGTAVVVVEQSANIALSLVDRAYFMERGAVRFEGPADDLTDRPDLLRSVFLGNAANAMGATD